MKIPTLLALLLLIIALTLGLATYYYHQKIQTQKKQIFEPKNFNILNLNETSASVFWQTALPTSGRVLFGQNNFDQKISYPLSANHLVNLDHLATNSNIGFKIFGADFLYEQPQNFKTAPRITSPNNSANQPIFGTVVDSNLEPIDSALVLVQIEGAQILGSQTSSNGSFLIPLRQLRTKDLTNYFLVNEKINATLKIIKDSQTSQIKISLPLGNAVLPPLPLGQDLDLTEFIASSSTQIAKSKFDKTQTIVEKKAAPNDPLDLNSDGKINVVDISIVFQSFGKITVKTTKADLNHDGIIDQKDVDLIKKALTIT